MDCTLKVNMILGDGKYYSRGSIVDRDKIPPHLRTSENIVSGVVSIDRVMPIDTIEVTDLDLGDEESPMTELTLDQLPPQVVAPAHTAKKKLVKRR